MSRQHTFRREKEDDSLDKVKKRKKGTRRQKKYTGGMRNNEGNKNDTVDKKKYVYN